MTIPWFILGVPNLYVNEINNDLSLNRGNTYYDARTLAVTVHGTGLFHFRVTLGHFETFDEVTGYFVVSFFYSSITLNW